MKKETMGCTTALLALIAMVIIGPILYYFGGWITGHILKWLIGDTVINGMNYVFNTTRFTTNMLPTICGTLGVVGSFFRGRSSSNSSD